MNFLVEFSGDLEDDDITPGAQDASASLLPLTNAKIQAFEEKIAHLSDEMSRIQDKVCYTYIIHHCFTTKVFPHRFFVGRFKTGRRLDGRPRKAARQ